MNLPDYDPRGNKDVGDISEPEHGASIGRIVEWLFDLVRWLRQREPVTPGDPFTKFATRGYLVSKGLLTEKEVLGDDDPPVNGQDAEPVPYVYVHARETYPSISNGATALSTRQLTAAKPNVQYIEFSPLGDTSVDFQLIMPDGWPGKAFQYRVYWTHTSGGVGTYHARWKLQAHSATDMEAIGSDFADGGTITDTGGTADTLYISPESAPISISGVNAKAGDLIFLRLTRPSLTDAADTLSIGAQFLAIRFNLGESPVEFPPTGDPYWANVTLLVQGGTNGSLVIDDLSTFASSVTIAADASFSSTQQVFGNNMIQVTPSHLADIPAFTSSGAGSRFTRPSGEDYTIETWVYVPTGGLSNVTISAALWEWIGPLGSIARLTLYANTGELQLRIGASEAQYATLSLNVNHFVQFTVIGNTYYLDLDGVQQATGALAASDGAGTWEFQAASIATPGIQAATYTATPLRVTKGVARARGAVPTAAFPIGP